MNVFLDTNILIDVLEKRKPFFLQSANILELGYRKRLRLYATSLSFINSLYVSRKSLGREVALEKIKALRDIIEVSPISSTEFDNALSLGIKDIEDALQFCSAKSANCNIIITRNKKDFPSETSMKVLTPQEFFEIYASELKW